MSGSLDRFERIARSIDEEPGEISGATPTSTEYEEPHPFDARNIHRDLPSKVRKLFDDGHCEQSVFEAFKFIEKEIKRISALQGKTGYSLMMEAFNENNAKVKLNALQRGRGVRIAIRALGSGRAAASIGYSSSAAKCSGGRLSVSCPSRSSVRRTLRSVMPITAPDSS